MSTETHLGAQNWESRRFMHLYRLDTLENPVIHKASSAVSFFLLGKVFGFVEAAWSKCILIQKTLYGVLISRGIQDAEQQQ